MNATEWVNWWTNEKSQDTETLIAYLDKLTKIAKNIELGWSLREDGASITSLLTRVQDSAEAARELFKP